MRSIACILAAVLVLGAPVLAASAAPAQAAPPDIILIVTDDQRSDSLWVMPTVQSLAASGLMFPNAIATNPLCCPARASLLTGTYSHTNGVWSNGGDHGGFGAFDDRTTIATELRAAGYRTALVGKYLNQYNDAAYVPPGWDHWVAYMGLPDFTDYRLSDGTDGSAGYATDVLADRAETFLASTDPATPAFVYFAPYAPHAPSTPAPRHEHAVDGFQLPRPASFNERLVDDKPPVIRHRRLLDGDDRALLRAQAEGQLETLLAVDEAIARLMSAQAARGRPVLVIFTSDNGLSWGEHRWRTKVVPYEPSIRVPLVLAGTGVAPGVVEALAGGIDVAPTIAEAAGITLPGAEGRSLLQPVPVSRTLMLEHYGGKVPPYCGIRTPGAKYVRYADGFTEVYNLRRDPDELRNRPWSVLADRLRPRARSACRGNLPPGMSW